MQQAQALEHFSATPQPLPHSKEQSHRSQLDGRKFMRNQRTAPQRKQGPAKESGEFRIGGGLPVTRLGFGAMRITGSGVWGEPTDRAEAIRVLRRAVELGINFIDTADSYGPGVSEKIIAEALHPYPEGLVIATKGGYARLGPNQWVEDGPPEHLRAACEASLRRLRVECIDLYQLQRIDPKVPAEDQLGTLRHLRAHGMIKDIGLSEVSVKQIESRELSFRSSACRIVIACSIAGRKMFLSIAKEKSWASFRGSRSRPGACRGRTVRFVESHLVGKRLRP